MPARSAASPETGTTVDALPIVAGKILSMPFVMSFRSGRVNAIMPKIANTESKNPTFMREYGLKSMIAAAAKASDESPSRFNPNADPKLKTAVMTNARIAEGGKPHSATYKKVSASTATSPILRFTRSLPRSQ